MQNLFILGIKHSGKTTFAHLLADHLKAESVDSDDLVKRKIEPLSVREYYKQFGSEEFRKREVEAVREYIQGHSNHYIMSMGGGASDNRELLELLKKNGKLIYLKRNEKDMLPVILKHGVPAFLDENNLEDSFHELYTRRNAIYENVADRIIDMGSYRDRTETLESLIRQLGDIAE